MMGQRRLAGRDGTPGRRGLGIRGKLFLAFGAVAGLTVLASAVAFVSYDQVGRGLRGITETNLPAMSLSLRLAKSSADLAAAAPVLLAAGSEAERGRAVAALRADQRELGDTIDALAATSSGAPAATRARALLRDIAANLHVLDDIVVRRLALRNERTAMAVGVRDAHAALAAKLAPLVDDAGFDLSIGLQSATDAGDTKAIQQQLSELADKQLAALQAMSDLRADSNLVLGLLTEAANIPDKDLLPPLRDRFAAASGRVEKALTALGAMDSAGMLRQLSGELLRYGSGTPTIFDLRLRELEAVAAGEAALTANRNLNGGLTAEVAKIVAGSESEAGTAAAQSAATIARGRVLLGSIAVASLFVALAIAALYVGRVVRRMRALRASMAEIAAGKFGGTDSAGAARRDRRDGGGAGGVPRWHGAGARVGGGAGG